MICPADRVRRSRNATVNGDVAGDDRDGFGVGVLGFVCLPTGSPPIGKRAGSIFLRLVYMWRTSLPIALVIVGYPASKFRGSTNSSFFCTASLAACFPSQTSCFFSFLWLLRSDLNARAPLATWPSEPIRPGLRPTLVALDSS